MELTTTELHMARLTCWAQAVCVLDLRHDHLSSLLQGEKWRWDGAEMDRAKQAVRKASSRWEELSAEHSAAQRIKVKSEKNG